MYATIIATFSALALSAVISPFPTDSFRGKETNEQLVNERATATTCIPVVFFAARGSDPEQATLGYNPRYSVLPTPMVKTANKVISKNGGDPATGLHPLNYSAINPSPENIANGNYAASVAQGAMELQQNIRDFITNCPAGKIFVSGFSQGAQVVSSALGGSSRVAPLDTDSARRITGVTLLADPTYLDGLNIDRGSGANNNMNGTAVRDGTTQRYLENNYAGRLRSYCQAGDQFCDSGTGANARAIHLNAPKRFKKRATTFLSGL